MSTPAVVVNLSLHHSEDKIFQDTIYQSNGTTLQDITNWNVSFLVHTYGDPTNVFITKTTANSGIVLSNPTLGVLQISIVAADTSVMIPGEYEFVISREDAGNSAVVTKGLFTILRR